MQDVALVVIGIVLGTVLTFLRQLRVDHRRWRRQTQHSLYVEAIRKLVKAEDQINEMISFLEEAEDEWHARYSELQEALSQTAKELRYHVAEAEILAARSIAAPFFHVSSDVKLFLIPPPDIPPQDLARLHRITFKTFDRHRREFTLVAKKDLGVRDAWDLRGRVDRLLRFCRRTVYRMSRWIRHDVMGRRPEPTPGTTPVEWMREILVRHNISLDEGRIDFGDHIYLKPSQVLTRKQERELVEAAATIDMAIMLDKESVRPTLWQRIACVVEARETADQASRREPNSSQED